jgi:hypothetical protein
MKKKSILLLTFLFLSCLFLCSCANQSRPASDPKKDLMGVKVIVQQYYINLEKMKYSESLEYIDYNNFSLKQDEINWLEQNKSYYKILFSNGSIGNIVGYEYSPQAKKYRVISSFAYSVNGKEFYINESVYLKKINGKYKIIHISSSDKFLNKRSNSNSLKWDEIYDKNNYIPIA